MKDKKFLTLQQIEDTIIKKGGKCTNHQCRRKIRKRSIKSHEHEGGIEVKGFSIKQRVFFHCYWCQMNSSIAKVRELLMERN